MPQFHLITPVKDSLETTREAVARIGRSQLEQALDYTVYNDFSSPQTTAALQEMASQGCFRLVNLSDLTDHPSPNYLLVLQLAQQRALAENVPLVLVESDVLVNPDTFARMLRQAQTPGTGMVAAVTVDREGRVAFPYLYARHWSKKVHRTRKRLSFCCTLLTPEFLRAFDFHLLDASKDWFDVFISHTSAKLGFSNYLMMDTPVVHLPHGSRPWKQLKYTHPIKYYWIKYTKGFDKI